MTWSERNRGRDPLIYLFFLGLLLLPILFAISIFIDKNSPLAKKMRMFFSGSSHPLNQGYGEFLSINIDIANKIGRSNKPRKNK